MDLIESLEGNPIDHWYYWNKYKYVEKNMPITVSKIADIGAGSALFSKQLLLDKKIKEVQAIDTNYTDDTLKNSDSQITYLKSISDFRGIQLVLLTDVIEHVEHDLLFMKELVNRVEEGTYFLITVPAHMMLWSSHDDYLHHFRRYNKEGLIKLLSEVELTINKQQYIFGILFPIVFILRKIRKKSLKSDLKNHSFLVNSLMKILLYFDSPISRFLPFGVSIIVKARKISKNIDLV